jgi:hypothetical protein
MALQDYAKLPVWLDGNGLEQVTSLEFVTNSGQQRVDLLNEGLGGFTPGSGDVTVTIGYAVPIGGTEDTFQQKCAAGAYVSIQVGTGAVAYVGFGKILTNTISQSTGGSTEGSLEWTGELRAME